MAMKKKKVFLIINSYYIGDILLVNPLVQNIKRIYDDAHVVMLVPPNMVDVAKYQEGVDDVVVWDRHGIHKGVKNMFKFIWNFPYKKIYASFPIFVGDRAITLAWLLRSKYIIGVKNNIVGLFLNSKYKVNQYLYTDIQGQHVSLLTGLTKEKLINCHIKYNVPEVNSDIINSLENNKGNYIVLCPTSSKTIKDMPKEDVCEIIEKLDCSVVLLGRGESAEKLSRFLGEKNFENLIDLTNKTSFTELAQAIKMSKGCISVDTGTLHMASALDVPTVGVYYKGRYIGYKPTEEIYKNVFCASDLSPTEILERLSVLTK